MRVSVLLVLLASLPARAALGQTCGSTVTYTDSFTSTTYRDAGSSVAGWGSGTLSLLGQTDLTAGTSSSQTSIGFPSGEEINYALGADLNGDGKDDIVTMTEDCNILYGINRGFSAGSFLGWSFGRDGPASDTSAHKTGNHDHEIGECDYNDGILALGDFDDDNDIDVVYIEAEDLDGKGTLEKCDYYENTGVASNDPIFADGIDCDPPLRAAGAAWHWRSGTVQVIDWNKDGKDDLVLGSSHGSTNHILFFESKGDGTFKNAVVLLADAKQPAAPNIVASASKTANGGNQCPPTPPKVGRGISALAIGDYDADNDYDIVVGSVSDDILTYFKNDGAGNFTQQPDIPFADGAAAHPAVGDFDGDGDLDFIIGRNGTNLQNNGSSDTCLGKDGKAYLFRNDGAGNFTQVSPAITDLGDDTDWVVSMDADGDGRLDVMVGSDKPTDNVYLATSTTTLGGFNTAGTALSTAVDSVNNATHGIVSVRVAAFSTSNLSLPGRNIELFVSNDNGVSWEPLTATELPPTSSWHDFTSFGADLRWKALFTTAADNGDGTGSQSPQLADITLEYLSVEQRRYSRSGLTLGRLDIGGSARDLVISASFYHPGFKATVQAWDITDFSAAANSLTRVDTHASVSLAWDAGALLRDQSGASRAIYGAYSPNDVGPASGRLRLEDGQLTTTTPTLQSLLNVASADEGRAVLAFVRNGMGSSDGWKLYDVGHSTPVLVGPPAGLAAYLGNDYAVFQQANASRDAMVYIGTNDGMVHAFLATSGAEQWAFVPHNLLGRLKMQRNTTTGVEIYQHGYFVDGTLVVQDMYDTAASRWRTVLIGGQARGKGKGDDNFYFALDVTNPYDPQPMWEFTDPVCVPPAVCTAPDQVLGESWSAPAPAQVKIDDNKRWVVFFGSGYDNRGTGEVGRSVYAVDAWSGAALARWDVDDLPYDASANPSTIDNTLPGGLSLADIDDDGLADRAYFGDLEGRLWKIDVSKNGTTGGGLVSHDDWPSCVLFDAGDPDDDGNRDWAPIITRPAVAVLNRGNPPNIYFGTGGDDRAPDTSMYRFYSVRDDSGTTCRATPKHDADLSGQAREWIVGDGIANTPPYGALVPANAEGDAGDRYWADPVIVDNASVFFASLYGKIESVNPCNSLSGTSKIFGYAIQAYSLSSDARKNAGESIFDTPWLASTSKVRQAVIVRPPATGTLASAQSGGYGTSSPATARPATLTSAPATEVIMQRFGDGLDAVGTGGVQASRVRSKMLRWREVKW